MSLQNGKTWWPAKRTHTFTACKLTLCCTSGGHNVPHDPDAIAFAPGGLQAHHCAGDPNKIEATTRRTARFATAASRDGDTEGVSDPMECRGGHDCKRQVGSLTPSLCIDWRW